MGRVARAEFGGPMLSRRTFLAAAAAAGAGFTMADLLAACGGGGGRTKGGSNTVSQLAGVLHDYVPVSFFKPEFPAVTGPAGVATPAAYLKWPEQRNRALANTVASGSAAALP